MSSRRPAPAMAGWRAGALGPATRARAEIGPAALVRPEAAATTADAVEHDERRY